MEWRVQPNDEKGILEARFSDSPDLEELKEAVLASLKLCEKHGITKVLADCSELVFVNNSILDTYELGAFYESLDIGVQMKEAIILPADEKAAKMMHFFETTARNRGFNIRVFSGYNAALAWLLKG